MARITNKDFKARVSRLEKLLGIELTFNIWEKHFSVYTVKDKCDQRMLVQAQNVREAVGQISAIINTLHVLKEQDNEK